MKFLMVFCTSLLLSVHVYADEHSDRDRKIEILRAAQRSDSFHSSSLDSCPLKATLSCGSNISSSLTFSSCIDTVVNNRGERYTFQGTAGQVVAFELSSSSFTTFLWVTGPGFFSDSGNILSFLSSGKSTERVDFYVPVTGTYTIEAESLYGPGDSQPSTGPYTLKMICATATPPPPTCVNANTLCAQSGRFQVTLFARDQRTGNSGPGLAIPANDLFGYFSIPALTGNPGNPEVFVKVLDGRPVNGKYWVFYNGLTDMEYTLVVLDTSTGVSRTYTKPAGGTCGGFDTSAF